MSGSLSSVSVLAILSPLGRLVEREALKKPQLREITAL